MRAADGLRLGVLDDDPTGSQAVHNVQVVTVLDEKAYGAALDGPAGTCFVLTNTRSLDEPAAVEMNQRAARGLIAVAERAGVRVQLISRSDSTLRGHVMAEVAALQAVRYSVSGRGFDGVLLVPAFLEAGRVTAGDIHWARLGADLVPVGETEFARDAAFGYRASDLRDFIAEKSGGTIRPGDVASISLADIRLGGPSRVQELLAQVRDGRWVVVNATEYSDLDAVACGVLRAERNGRSFLFRTGPSFVRALLGMGPKAPLRGAQIWPPASPAAGGGPTGGPTGDPAGDPAGGHGLVVVGSHVGQTSRQVAALNARGGVTGVELDVPALIRGDDVITPAVRQVGAGGPGPGRRPGHRPRGVGGAVPGRPRHPGRGQFAGPGGTGLDRGQGRDHLARRGRVRSGHPAGGGHRAALPWRDLGIAPAGGGTRGDWPPVRGLRRQRRR